jgi:LysR family nod box-dependent transcriptional activator
MPPIRPINARDEEAMRLSSIDLNLLVALDALLAERNVTRAALRVGMTQPGMSNALTRLRRLFDDELLVRNGRTFTLSPRAEELVAQVTDVLARIQQTLEVGTSFDPGRDEHHFCISASDYATLVLIGPLVRRLSVEAPGVTVDVEPRSPDVPRLLAEDRVDFVIEPLELMPGVKFPRQRLLRDHWLSAVWAGNPHVGSEMTKETFLELGHMIYSIGRSHQLALPDQFLRASGVDRKIEYSVESFLLAPFLMKGTNLTALIPARTRPAIEQSGDIKFVPPPYPVPNITEHLWWHPRHTTDAAHTWFRNRFAMVAVEIDDDHEDEAETAPAQHRL